MAEAMSRRFPGIAVAAGLAVFYGVYMFLDEPLLTVGDHDIPESNNDWIGALSTELQEGYWDPHDPDEFRKLIRLLVKVGIPYKVIAEIVGVAQGTVRGWESGKSTPGYPGRMSVFQRVRQFLDTLK